MPDDRREIVRALDDPSWRVQCVHTARSTGERCRRWAIRGSTVCLKHGGNAEHIKKKAAERIENLKAQLALAVAPHAVAKLVALMESEDDKVALKAATEVLDRVGLTAAKHSTVDVKHTLEPTDLDRRISEVLEATASEGPKNPSRDRPSVGLPQIDPALLPPPGPAYAAPKPPTPAELREELEDNLATIIDMTPEPEDDEWDFDPAPFVDEEEPT